MTSPPARITLKLVEQPPFGCCLVVLFVSIFWWNTATSVYLISRERKADFMVSYEIQMRWTETFSLAYDAFGRLFLQAQLTASGVDVVAFFAAQGCGDSCVLQDF